MKNTIYDFRFARLVLGTSGGDEGRKLLYLYSNHFILFGMQIPVCASNLILTPGIELQICILDADSLNRPSEVFRNHDSVRVFTSLGEFHGLASRHIIDIRLTVFVQETEVLADFHLFAHRIIDNPADSVYICATVVYAEQSVNLSIAVDDIAVDVLDL